MALTKNVKLLIGLGVLLIVGLMVMSSYNGLVSARTGVETQENQVGVAYARKLDLIPGLTSLAQQYLQNETEVQARIAALRSGACADPKSLEEQDTCSSQVTETNNFVIRVVNENYPNLKGIALYENVQTEMVNSQNKISTEQVLYNDAVGAYNAKVQKFPTNLMAGLFGFEAKPFIGTKSTGGSAAGLGQNNLN